MLNFIQNFFGANFLKKKDIARIKNFHRLSKYFPYRYYDKENEMYYNVDESIGIIFECRPLVFAGDRTFKNLETIFNQAFPHNTVVSFMLYADPNIDYILDAYKNLKTRKEKSVSLSTKNVIRFFKDGTQGIKKVANIPVRDFRLFISVKVTDINYNLLDAKENLRSVLDSNGFHPQMVSPLNLIKTLHYLLNGEPSPNITYDDTKLINEQILKDSTVVKVKTDRLEFDDKIFKCQTVKQQPREVDSILSNFLTGGIAGQSEDAMQILSPFILTTNLIFASLNKSIHGKCNLILGQKGAGSWSIGLKQRQDEFMWASNKLQNNEKFVRTQMMIWYIATNEKQSSENTAKVKNIWENQGFLPQQDKLILPLLLLNSLPLGVYSQHKNVEFIERDFIAPSDTAIMFSPVSADFNPYVKPICLFTGRKGQIVSLDFFSSPTNFNSLVMAESGAGKSFFINNLVYNYYSANAKIRIIDIGGSYKKICNILNGKFIDFTNDSNICINPFTFIQDMAEELDSVKAVICQMVYSFTKAKPSETQIKIINDAILVAWEKYRQATDIDNLYEIFKNPLKFNLVLQDIEEACEGDSCTGDIIRLSTEIAYNIQSFTSAGTYGKWFNGPANLDINHDFVVLELEELKKKPELFNVVVLQILNAVTNNLYGSSREEPRMIFFDEAWQFFTDETSFLIPVIEGGYRKARKYKGSFTCITQSPLDTEGFGRVGQVLQSNSAFKFYLQSRDFQKAQKKNVIEFSPMILELAESIKNVKPKYSEILIDSPFGTGIVRLVVDDFSYWLYTSDPNDDLKIKNIMKKYGIDYFDAIERIVKAEKTEA